MSLGEIRQGWLDYESTLKSSPPEFAHPVIHETDLATINYTSGTTSRPKGVMITHRNAYMNVVGTLIHFPMTPADRYLWTFVWTVTAAGGTHVCLGKVEAKTAFEKINSERITVMCAAPTVLIFLANAPERVRKGVRAGVRVLTAGAPPAAATIERIESEFGWILTHIYGLTETSPFISVCEPRPEHQAFSAPERCVIKARQGVELITSGELRVAGLACHVRRK